MCFVAHKKHRSLLCNTNKMVSFLQWCYSFFVLFLIWRKRKHTLDSQMQQTLIISIGLFAFFIYQYVTVMASIFKICYLFIWSIFYFVNNIKYSLDLEVTATFFDLISLKLSFVPRFSNITSLLPLSENSHCASIA